MINFTPLKDMILVKPDPRPERIGSIFVPDGALPQGHQAGEKEESYRDCFVGTVMAVGRGDKHKAGTHRHPMLTKIGDRVVYPRRPSSPGGEFSVKIDGEMYLIFNEQQNAFAVIEE